MFYIKSAGILIDGGKIKKVFRKEPVKIPVEARTLDAKGKIVSAGFIDVHLQGAGGFDFLDATPAAIERISQTLAKFGTTSYLATTVFKNGTNNHIENLTAYDSQLTAYHQGAQLLGIHLEGP
ncbi:MAG: N-acetylglucosamine-6-phosphate deacetylase, partial [Candidatus Omnitrophica bacterium]|nr:N-acetylglucosamine-6-phosphate deacetylase [Candidatus Omnitrophota bacterium]